MAKGSKRGAIVRPAALVLQDQDEEFDSDSYSDDEHEQTFSTKSSDAMAPYVQGEGMNAGAWASEVQAILDLNTLMGLFYNEDWVHIVIDRIASKIATQKLRVYRRVKGSKSQAVDEVHNHQINRLFEQPNDYQDYHAFMYSIVAYYCMIGNAVINHQAVSQRLIPLPTENINLRFDHRKMSITSYDVMSSSSYDLNIMQTRWSYNPREVIHIRRPNPGSLIWGLSPFIPGRKSILFGRYSQEYLLNFYLKGAQPGVVLSMANEANEKVATRLLASFEKANTGRRNQRKTMLLPKGVTANSFDHKLADQRLIEYVNNNRDTIINLLGAPRHEFSIAEAGSLGSEEYKQALKNFWAGPLRNIQQVIAGAFTRGLRSYLGDDCYLDFDNSDVDVLQENLKEKAELAQLMLETHSINEIRAELYDKEPVEGGDEIASLKPAPDPFGRFGGGFGGGFGAPPAQNPEGLPNGLPGQLPPGAEELDEEGNPLDPKLDGEDIPEAEEKALETGEQDIIEDEIVQPDASPHQANLEKLAALKVKHPDWWERREEIRQGALQPAEAKVSEIVLELITTQADAAIKALAKVLGKKAKTKAESKSPSERIREEIGKATSEVQDTIVVDLVTALEPAAEAGYQSQLILPMNEQNTARMEALQVEGKKQRRAILEDRELKGFQWVSRTNSELIMQRIDTGLAEQSTIQQIADSIMALIGAKGDPLYRSMRIARTEVMTASSIGEAAAMEAAATIFPKLKKAWISTADARTRDSHDNLQGEVRAWNKPFSNGLSFPHDPTGPASETINCRCSMLTITDDDAEAIGLEELSTTLPKKPREGEGQ